MHRKTVLIYLFIFLSHFAFSQQSQVDSLKTEYDKKYGLDVLLFNGKKSDAYYKIHEGHPFWQKESSLRADLVIKDKKFYNREVNYNIEKQEFILNYENYYGAQKKLVINYSLLDSVFIGDKTFVRNNIPSLEQRYLQLIYKGKIQCYAEWYKPLEIKENVRSHSGLKYKKEFKHLYLIQKETIERINGNRSFLNAFPREYKAKIRKFMSVNDLRIKNISDENLKEILVFCENLMK